MFLEHKILDVRLPESPQTLASTIIRRLKEGEENYDRIQMFFAVKSLHHRGFVK